MEYAAQMVNVWKPHQFLNVMLLVVYSIAELHVEHIQTIQMERIGQNQSLREDFATIHVAHLFPAVRMANVLDCIHEFNVNKY